MIIGKKVQHVTFNVRVRDESVTLIKEYEGSNPYEVANS